jgi:Na+-transporting methylmalonyl-CoA/oxaloacetate decarboxylase gamma subunit
MGASQLLGADIEEWHKWAVYILGDLLLLAAVIGLMSRLVKRSIKSVIQEETTDTKERAEETAKKVDDLLVSSKANKDHLEELSEVVGRVVYQVQPNKGGSIRDAIDRTEKAVSDLVGQVSVIDAKVDEARVDIAGVKGQIKGL